MEIFTKYNRKGIKDSQFGTLIGIISCRLSYWRHYKRKTYTCIFFLIALLASTITFSHSTDPRGAQPLDWHTEQISQVISFLPFFRPGLVKTQTIEGKRCMLAPMFSINVNDQYAYDIDETVTVEIEFDTETTTTDILLQYDKNGGAPGVQNIQLTKNEGHRFYRHTFILERARFAGGNNSNKTYFIINGDLSIGGISNLIGNDNKNITVCDIVIKRSYKTSKSSEYGRLSLNLVDESGNPIPARVGIYDATGRMPLPQQDAIPVRHYSEITRSFPLPNDRISWPSNNPKAFYVNGSYHARLPVGNYNLVVARGLEFRILQTTFKIEENQDTPVAVKLTRWTDMSAKGWYSGDVHIHSTRRSPEDGDNIRLHTQAEDLNVANLLQMGNIGEIYYRQYDWGHTGQYGDYPYTLVSGQEDPRTARLGHTIQLNIDKPIRFPKRYYLYHHVFEETHKQGGLAGYAHAGLAPPLYTKSKCPGLALDLPYNLVDFVEVVQMGTTHLECWFDALNLGYKISPAAGSDFPYAGGAIPGEVRSYVKTGKPYSIQAWFDNLKAGSTFATNGPMLELMINGHGMGSELTVNKGDRLVIDVKATINPDIDLLEKIELIQQGDVVAIASSENGATELHLKHEVQVNNGSWFVLRAQGKSEKIVAVSAPIYVYAADMGFCKLSAIPSIVTKMKQRMQEIVTLKIEQETEAWDTLTRSAQRRWSENEDLLRQRINYTVKQYDKLSALSAQQKCIVGSFDTTELSKLRYKTFDQ